MWIQGVDEVLPALDRRDAHERAQKANTIALWAEVNREPSGLDEFRPIIWAVPRQYGQEFSPYAGWAAEQVEDAWKRWNAGV